mgnify:CR=1 FL=1
MALSFKLDHFVVNSADAVGTKYARSGYGFQPKAAIMWASARTESTDTVGSQTSRESLGMFAYESGTTIVRDSIGTAGADGVTTMD